jgi:hypothetical protein
LIELPITEDGIVRSKNGILLEEYVKGKLEK